MERQQAESTEPSWKEQGKNDEDVNALSEMPRPGKVFCEP